LSTFLSVAGGLLGGDAVLSSEEKLIGVKILLVGGRPHHHDDSSVSALTGPASPSLADTEVRAILDTPTLDSLVLCACSGQCKRTGTDARVKEQRALGFELVCAREGNDSKVNLSLER
jgi:hypothetical protein